MTADTCDRVDVKGDVALAVTATLTVSASDEALWLARRGDEIPVLTWTGELQGHSLTLSPTLPRGWMVRVDAAAKSAFLVYVSPGTMLKVL